MALQLVIVNKLAGGPRGGVCFFSVYSFLSQWHHSVLGRNLQIVAAFKFEGESAFARTGTGDDFPVSVPALQLA